MGFDSKYAEIVTRNDLNGSALIFGDVADLKELLGMTFGEWATFRLHFLGLPTHLRPQNKNTLSPSHSQKQLPGFPLHAAHQYSSNPNLVNSCM